MKKILQVLICAVLILTVLSGCRKGERELPTVNPPDTGETETETETKAETEPVPTETEPVPTETEPVPEETEPVWTPAPETEPVWTPAPETEPVWTPAPGTEPVWTPAPETQAPETAPSQPQAADGYTANGFPITTVDGITYIEGIPIVNKTYPLPSWYDPGGMTAECAAAFHVMQEGAMRDGISLFSISDYRSYALQQWLYQTYVDRDGRELADTFSARPGHSEHQTGLAIDLNSCLKDFAYTAEGRWIAAHCWDYGFIIRYPEGKEWATGFVYEPWHVRYVGTELAAVMRDNGLSLEEYFGIDSVYR